MTCLEIWETAPALEQCQARDQRLSGLLADLGTSRVAVGAERDQARLLELLRRHVRLQDAVVGELLRPHGHRDG